jgi:hypothetical protein
MRANGQDMAIHQVGSKYRISKILVHFTPKQMQYIRVHTLKASNMTLTKIFKKRQLAGGAHPCRVGL